MARPTAASARPLRPISSTPVMGVLAGLAALEKYEWISVLPMKKVTVNERNSSPTATAVLR